MQMGSKALKIRRKKFRALHLQGGMIRDGFCLTEVLIKVNGKS